MKKVAFYLLVVSILHCIYSSVLYSDNTITEFQLLEMNLYGIYSNSKVVIAYGENTNILISTDKGESWSQKAISGNLVSNFNKLTVVNDVFYGIIDSTVIVKSEDGFNWSKHYKPVSNKFIDISADTNFVYLLSSEMNKIFIFDRKTFQLVDSVELNFDIIEIFAYKNVVCLGTYDGKLLVYNSGFSSIPVILDLSNIGSYVYRFFSDGDKVYFYVSSSLCSLDVANTTANVVLKYGPTNCIVKNGEIYSVRAEITYLFNTHRTRWVGFYKYDINQNEFIKLNNDNLDRFIDDFNSFLPQPALNFQFIDDERIIIVAKNKTILISGNGGINWQLKSFFYNSNSGVYVLKNYLWRPAGRTILRSTDFGATWLPQKADSLFVISLQNNNGIRYVYFDSLGKGFIVNYLEYRYSDSSRNFQILYTNDFGENYMRGDNARLMWLGIGSNSLSEIVRFKDKFVLKRVNLNNINNGKTPFSHLEFFDTNFTNTGLRLFNDTVLYKICFLGNNDTYMDTFLMG